MFCFQTITSDCFLKAQELGIGMRGYVGMFADQSVNAGGQI
jgi:hypothetical protein